MAILSSPITMLDIQYRLDEINKLLAPKEIEIRLSKDHTGYTLWSNYAALYFSGNKRAIHVFLTAMIKALELIA